MNTPQGYVLGIGTNQDPARNVPLIVSRLLDSFGKLLISRCYKTAPIGMESTHHFVNFCAFISTSLEPAMCKAKCVAIEVELGRDRTHPSSNIRDRPADIDLLARVGAHGEEVQLQPVANYLTAPAAEIAGILSPGKVVPIARGSVCTFRLNDIFLGEAPASIDRDNGTRLVVVR